MRRKSFEHRFWEKTRVDGDCILWTARCDTQGYRAFRIGEKLHLAHRVAYQLAFGEYESNLCVFHTGCENRSCVNPEHLTLGTYDEVITLRGERGHHPVGDRNGLRLHPERAARGERNGTQTHPESVRRGEQHYAAKLTAKHVEDIRSTYEHGEATFWTLAQIYGVNPATIWQIVQGKKWHAPS